MAVESSAEAKAAPGFAEFKFDDGAMVQVSAYAGQVIVLQMSGGTQGRGAAFISPDDADALAVAIEEASAVARQQADASPAPATPALADAPISAAAPAAPPAIDYDQLAEAIVRARAKQPS